MYYRITPLTQSQFCSFEMFWFVTATKDRLSTETLAYYNHSPQHHQKPSKRAVQIGVKKINFPLKRAFIELKMQRRGMFERAGNDFSPEVLPDQGDVYKIS